MAFQGSLQELPLPDIIQLVSVSGKTGMFLLESGGSKGEIYLQEGQIVHKGEILVRINTDRLIAQRRQQQAQLAEFEVRRNAAEAQISQAQAQLRLAKETLAKTERLLAQGAATQQRRDELSTEVEADIVEEAVV